MSALVDGRRAPSPCRCVWQDARVFSAEGARYKTGKPLQWVPLPVWPQSAKLTGAKQAEEHEPYWRATQGDAPPTASLALGYLRSHRWGFCRCVARDAGRVKGRPAVASGDVGCLFG